MTGKGHVLFGLSSLYSVQELLSLSLSVPEWVVMGGIVVFSSLLPDIDHPQSTFGRKVKLLSYPISQLFGHRGITHSLLMVLIIFYFLFYIMPAYYLEIFIVKLAMLAFVIGYGSHLVGDMLTPSGIPLFWPIKKRFAFGLVKNGLLGELIVCASLPCLIHYFKTYL